MKSGDFSDNFFETVHANPKDSLQSEGILWIGLGKASSKVPKDSFGTLG